MLGRCTRHSPGWQVKRVHYPSGVDPQRCRCNDDHAVRGRSSVGRATRSQCVGQGFESPRLHSHEPRRDRRRAHLPASGITPNAIGPGRRAPESGLAGERCSGLTVNDQSIAFDLLLIRWPTRWTIKRARVFPPVENRCHMRAEAVERFVIGAAVRRRWRQKAIG